MKIKLILSMLLVLFTIHPLSSGATSLKKTIVPAIDTDLSRAQFKIVFDFSALTSATLEELIQYVRTNSPCILVIENVPTTDKTLLNALVAQLNFQRIQISKNRYVVWISDKAIKV